MQHRVAEEVPLRFRSREHAGAELARAHGADLDVLVAKKVGAPGNAELAVGAVTAGGTRVRNEDVLALTGAPEAWVNRAFVRAQESASAKEARLRAGRAPLDVGGRHVLLVDDGLATGATALCCARELRARGAARVTLAVPVGSRAACALLAREVDEVVCLRQPADFAAVGEHYDDFTQVSDDEATVILMSATRA
jgi:predicted phosphoribosyltransferase